MESEYFVHEHPLIFIEDLKVDGEEKVVCGVCEEPPSGPVFKCSECNFLCHQSCTKLPNEIQHPLHPNHTLLIRPPANGRNDYCVACGKCCGRCFFYFCDQRYCNFNLDTKCASRWRVNKNDCHKHTYVPFFKQIQFTCEACGEEGKDIICLYCTTCQLLIHANCASFSHTTKIADHDHLLTLTYFVHQLKEHANILCKLCSKEVNTKYATYYCQKCSYFAHLICTRWCDLGKDSNAITKLASVGSVGPITGLIKDINQVENEKSRPQEIKHFSHQHDLILNYEEVKDDKRCDGCMQLISPPFYSCAQCNFFIHNICAKLPTNTRHPLVSFPFTLLSQAPFSDGVFQCFFCEQYRHGFAYKREADEFLIDIQCIAFKETLEHEAHQHPLFLTLTPGKKCKFCEELGCFVCPLCNFALGFTCAILPLIAIHKYDQHPLKLTYSVEGKSKKYYCLICEEERNLNELFYYCAECDFPAHSQCVLGKYPYIKFEKTYKDKHHQHPLTFARKTEYSLPCDVCGDHFEEVGLECTQCKLSVHPRFSFPEKNCLQRLDKRGGKWYMASHMHT